MLILRCDEEYALVKRPDSGLLAGLWQFPEIAGLLDAQSAISALVLPVREVYRQLDKNHIFTHIEWKMRGIYLEIAEKSPNFQWFTAKEIAEQAALPTAFRQFWDARGDF